jgi:hypothetical protein
MLTNDETEECRVALTRATRRNILEDGILHSHHCENLKSYNYEIYDRYYKPTKANSVYLPDI